MDGGLDNWIAANGNEGERALADEQRCAHGRRFWTIVILAWQELAMPLHQLRKCAGWQVHEVETGLRIRSQVDGRHDLISCVIMR